MIFGWRLGLALGVSLALSATGAQAVEIQMRAGGSVAQREADKQVCTELAQTSVTMYLGPPRAPPQTPPTNLSPQQSQQLGEAGVVATAVGDIIVGLVVDRIDERNARIARKNLCLRQMGYVNLELTPQEAGEQRAAHGEAARTAWEDAFMKRDLAGRVTEAGRPPGAPPLSHFATGPWVGGAVRVDPRSVVISEG